MCLKQCLKQALFKTCQHCLGVPNFFPSGRSARQENSWGFVAFGDAPLDGETCEPESDSAEYSH